MDPCVGGKLRMERRGQKVILFYQDWSQIPARKHLNIGSGTHDSWCANENHLHRPTVNRSGCRDDGRVDLPSICVPLPL